MEASAGTPSSAVPQPKLISALNLLPVPEGMDPEVPVHGPPLCPVKGQTICIMTTAPEFSFPLAHYLSSCWSHPAG